MCLMSGYIGIAAEYKTNNNRIKQKTKSTIEAIAAVYKINNNRKMKRNHAMIKYAI